ncbi:phosphoglycerate kinase [Candidatus Saccharibacteria bacterium]|nr:phosphoglycerate kinase [Candidatus Saccharibacteria bacterium]
MKQSIQNIDVKGKVILVRVDYNVPLDGGVVASDLRIRASLPTLNYLRDHGAQKIILISHLGRPEGTKNKDLSLRPVADALKKLIDRVDFIDDVSGPDVEAAVRSMKAGDILLLENLRFYPGEEQNSESFIQEIIDSTGAEIFVQDGFAVIHRAHASTAAVAHCLPVYMGLLLEREVKALEKASSNPDRPLVVIIGGAKVEDKQPLIDKFTDFADHILVGGKIASDGFTSDSQKIYVAEDFDENSAGEKLDCGPLATSKFAEVIRNSKTVIWNGLLGKAEDPAFATSSTLVGELLGEAKDITSIICGGDTTAFVEKLQSEHAHLNYSLISTGGGASLDFLCDNPLPGLDVVEEA